MPFPAAGNDGLIHRAISQRLNLVFNPQLRSDLPAVRVGKTSLTRFRSPLRSRETTGSHTGTPVLKDTSFTNI